MKTFALALAGSVVAGIGPYYSLTQGQFSEPLKIAVWGLGLIVLGSSIRLGYAIREKNRT